jgi:Serine/threonine protein phosphatase
MVWWGNCGDSRLYLARHFSMLACTADHSLVKAGERNMEISGNPDDLSDVSRSALYTCLGGMVLPQIDVTGPTRLQPNDHLLLCSDGLWSALTQEKIIALLSSNSDIKVIANTLVENALVSAGKDSDNVTLIAIEWMPEENSHHQGKSEHVSQPGFKNMFADSEYLMTEIDSIKSEMDAVIKRIDKLD